MSQKYSELDKIKYVRAFQDTSTLTMYDYAKKMGIPGEDFKKWLQKYKDLPSFGTIKLNITEQPKVSTEVKAVSQVENVVTSTPVIDTKTIITFDNGSIKLELKENFSKELLQNLVEAMIKC